MKKINLILAFLALFFSSRAQLPALPPRPAVDVSLAPFYHGVASGDPLSDRVIIWTRVTPTVFGSMSVNWEMATDTLFTSVVNSGSVTTDSSLDYTVKVDVTGLNPNTWYYYRFHSGGAFSIAGRTKTLPVGNVDSIRLAIFSCSDFQTGYFNAFRDVASRNDLSAILHLGDWYYEYLAGGSDASGDTTRYHALTHDAFTLSDYRLWQSQYKLDDDTRAMLEQYPLIPIWDDHESANNSWYSGAQNHNPATQGPWFTRKNAAKQAYFEWNPIRPLATGNDTIIHRNFEFGDLFNLIMLDTRLEGRDSSLGSLLSPTNAYMIDTNRQMLGPVQLAWFKSQLSDATTKWKIIGNQVMISPLNLFGEVLNGDQWDGYPAEKDRVLSYISQNNINDVVFCSGDIHTSFANDIPGKDSTYSASTGAGSVATEMIGSSITSTASVPPGGAAAVTLANPWLKYIDFTDRGYLLLDINKTRAQGDYIHVSGTASKTFTTTDAAQWENLDGEHHLRTASSVLGPNPGNPPLVSPFPMGASTGVKPVANTGMIIFNCYPNPSINEVVLQYYLDQPSKIAINITDMSGRIIYDETTKEQPNGVNISEINTSGFPDGAYIISLKSDNGVYTKKIIKGK